MKKRTAALFLFLFAVSLQAYQEQQRTPEQISADLKKDPGNSALYVEMGDYYRSKKDQKKAKNNYEKAIALDKKNADAYYELSQILRKEKDYPKALDYARIASELKPLRSRYKSGIGLILYRMGKYGEAEKYFRESLNQSTKKNDFDFSMLGHIYMKQGKYKEAAGSFNQQQELKPWDKSINVSLARAYYKMNDKKKGDYYKGLAGEEWDKFREGADGEGDGKKRFERSKGWEQYKAREYGGAVKTFREDLKKAPDNLDCYLGLGYALRKMDKDKEALDAFSQAIKKDPSYAKAYVGRAVIRLSEKQYETAAKDLEFAIMADPDDDFAAGQLGRAYYFLNRFEEAVKQFVSAVKKEATDPFLLKMLAGSYQKLKEYRNAFKYYKLALKNEKKAKEQEYLKESVAFTGYMLAGELEKAGKDAEAKNIYQEVIRTAPKSKWAGYSRQNMK